MDLFKVKCIDNEQAKLFLTVGKIYMVQGLKGYPIPDDQAASDTYLIVDDGGMLFDWEADRFQRVDNE